MPDDPCAILTITSQGVADMLESPVTATVLDAVVSEQYDLGIITLPTRASGLNTVELATLNSVRVSPMGHTLSGYSALGAEALREQPFIMLTQGSPFRFKVERLFRRTRVQSQITRGSVEQPCVELQPAD